MHTKGVPKSLKGRGRLEDLVQVGMMILKQIIGKLGVENVD
jgi:hypothetical protein